MKIDGTTFVISGGASGLGRATTTELVRAGANVAIFDFNKELADEVVAELTPARVRFWEVDVLETETITAAVQGAVEWIKETGKQLAGVVAAAGVGTAAKIIDKNLTPLPLDTFDFTMGVNVRGSVDLVRQCLPHMINNAPLRSLDNQNDNERGIVILVSSAAAFDGQPGQVAYAASKGAVASLTLPMARDLARYGVRVVTIAPSLFETRMTAALPDKAKQSLLRVLEFPQRLGKGEEFAHLARAAIENTMLNGVVLRLDGATRMPSKM